MTDTKPEKPQNKIVKSYKYVSNNIRVSFVVYSFGLFAIICAIIPIIGGFALNKFNIALNEQNYDAKEAFFYLADLYDNLSILSGVLYILCAIIFLFWIYRASSNTHALYKENKIEFTPGWNIGSYFIPFLNLYWPYKGMKELVRLNVQTKWLDTVIILIWWLAFLFMNFTAKIALKITIKDQFDVESYIGIDAVSNILGVIAATIVIIMVREINKGQVSCSKEVNKGEK